MTAAEAIVAAARINYPLFIKVVNPRTEMTDFHVAYYQVLQRFAEGKVRRLIVSMPPQHGKSFGSTVNLPAYIFGLNPNARIAIASYNSTFAQGFNSSVQKVMCEPIYAHVFPATSLNPNSADTTVNPKRNASVFEIIGKEGYLRAVGRGGGLTGITVDIAILDDLYKDAMEANSTLVRDAAWKWYTTVVRTRLHNNSQELIVFTRWHEDDVIGRILLAEPHKVIGSMADLDGIDEETWAVINFEAIKDSDPTELDTRKRGEALWPDRHSVSKLEGKKKLDPAGFQSLYQGDPKPTEGLMYQTLRTYDYVPNSGEIKRKNYTDTADTGSDNLCSICYIETSSGCYVVDVLYTKKPMEWTEPALAKMLSDNDTQTVYIESNNGGRGFARNVEKLSRERGNTQTCFIPFTQRDNKQSRIFTASAAVQNVIFFPLDWERRWPEFARDTKSYRKEGGNAHDDAPDALTGVAERFQEKGGWADLLAFQGELTNKDTK